MINRRTLFVGGTAAPCLGGVFVYALLQRGGVRRLNRRQDEILRDAGNITDSMTSSLGTLTLFCPNGLNRLKIPECRRCYPVSL